MKELLDELRVLGCDVEGALERAADDEEMYLQWFQMALNDGSFDSLGECLKAGQCKEAFEQAHMLKGVVGNLGITPVFDEVVKIVEPLRAGNMDGLLPIYEDLMAKRQECMETVNKYM